MSVRSFAMVYEQHVAQVYGFFAYVRGSRIDAEDLTQQTFERALRGWTRYDESRGSLSSWLLAIARNLLVDHIRTAGTTRMQAAQENELQELAVHQDHHSLGLEPQLERALGELSGRERELIALRFGGDLSTPEIATLTGLSLANVQQILSRSLRRLRASLDEAATAAGERAAVR
jgi:RNA polymerase sigma-70 factor (ECF subfamily)